MTNNVLQICPSCAENNKAEWKNPRNTAPLFLAVCGVCKIITSCTHIQFWKGLRSDKEDWKLPVGDKNAARRVADQAKRDKAKAQTQSDILNG